MQTKQKQEKKDRKKTKPQTKTNCRGCFGASFGDCDKCRKERR